MVLAGKLVGVGLPEKSCQPSACSAQLSNIGWLAVPRSGAWRVLSVLCAVPLLAGVAADTAAQLRKSMLEAQECYRVRDLRFALDEVRLYFNEGFLIFSKPVNGTRVSAVFSADVEGGDGELLLMPPTVGERRSLAAFAHSPNLNEHFRDAVLVFSSDAAEELMEAVRSGGGKKSPEMGEVLAAKWNSVVGSFTGSFEVRLVQDLLSPRRKELGFFYAALATRTAGNFDLIHDPRMAQQISLGHLAYREDRRFFDIWTNFEARSWRMGQRRRAGPDVRVDDVKIDATIEPDLNLKAVTRLRVTPNSTERVIALDISQRMHVSEVKIDGAPGEVFSPESLRANLIRSGENNLVLISGDKEFAAGKAVELELAHEGKVIVQAGDGVYFVGTRAAWYPNRVASFSNHELTFRIPRNLDLVSTGDLVSESVEGEWKIIRRKTSQPVRFAGFNLGDFAHSTLTRNGIKIDVCANRKIEEALLARPRSLEMPPPTTPFPRRPTRNQNPPDLVMTPLPPPNPLARLQQLASEIASALDELTARFGKPPIQTLTVSPIPGRFGQGFPGLVYLSTLAYLEERDRPINSSSQMQQIFFSEILHAHEIAHQWWGNGVTSASYQDDWLMESLANYSALWVLEKKKGAKALDQVLDDYRQRLLRKDSGGKTVESGGPITLGHRLYSSQSPDAWVTVTYSKGAWIIHMLRRRMGDDAFQKMLSQLYQRNLYQAITTEDFRKLAVEFLPPGSNDPKLENFFEAWVSGTGIPSLKLAWKVTGKAPNLVLKGTITQSDVDEEFSIWAPVEIQTGRGKPVIKWVRTATDEATFEVKLAAAPTKVTLDPGNSTLWKR